MDHRAAPIPLTSAAGAPGLSSAAGIAHLPRMNADISDAVQRLLDTLEDEGVTHVSGVPDNTSGPLFDALAAHPGIRLVRVTREGEAFALASGLWMGGAAPLVVIQNTGLLESGDSLRGTAVRMGAPLPVMVTGRGWAKMRRAGLTPESERTRELMMRPDVDSVALLTEATLRAWGIPFDHARGPTAPALADTIRRARREERPVALLVTGGLA